MKNQYFGDINDYRKYGLLRCLASTGLRVGVCWMLTAPDSRNDGKKTAYLREPDTWRHLDQALFDLLKQKVDAGDRDVRHIEESGLLGAATFFSELLRDSEAARREYFERALQMLRGADLLFFDPDTGLEVPSVPFGRAESSRYLYWHEVKEAADGGASLILFQHWKRENRDEMICRLTSQLQALLPHATVAEIRTDFVLFLCACTEAHRAKVQSGLELVAKKWVGELAIRIPWAV